MKSSGRGKKWEAMDPEEDDTPNDYGADSMYGKPLPSNITGMSPKHKDGVPTKKAARVHWPDDPQLANSDAEPYIMEADEIQHEAFDKYILAKVCLPRGDNMAYGTVVKRSRDEDGNFVGKSNNNPVLDLLTTVP